MFTLKHQMHIRSRLLTYTIEITYNIDLKTGMIQNGDISYLIEKDDP